jgi:hypothetical protein
MEAVKRIDAAIEELWDVAVASHEYDDETWRACVRQASERVELARTPIQRATPRTTTDGLQYLGFMSRIHIGVRGVCIVEHAAFRDQHPPPIRREGDVGARIRIIQAR